MVIKIEPQYEIGIQQKHPSNTFAKISIIKNIPKHVVPDVRIDVGRRCYGIDQTQLVSIVHNKDMEMLHAFDGIKGLAKALRTDLENGIDGQDLIKRRAVFGSNGFKKPAPSLGLFYFVFEAFMDVTILILMGCAILSLGFGIKEDGIKDGWYEGGSILFAVFQVIIAAAVSNLKQFDSVLQRGNNMIKIDVVREGRRQKISTCDIVVGDVVVLNIGDPIPADGLFIDGHSLLIDESSMTGESDQLIDVNAFNNPFLISGAKVTDGYCQMLVLSVGMPTDRRKMMMMSSITDENNQQARLQSRLNKLTCLIGKIGLALAFLVLIVALILDSVTGIFSGIATILVVAIPKYLPLMVTLTLAYSIRRMLGNHHAIGSEIVGLRDIEYGLLESDLDDREEEEVVEGVEFRNFTNEERMHRNSAVKQKGHVVAVSGNNRTQDEPVFKEPEGANQSPNSVVLDVDTASISAVLMWGRCVYTNIQFQLTVNVAALVTNFVTGVTSGHVHLTAVHLLWVNLIMDTMGALATEGPTKELLNKAILGRTITNIMWRNLFAQAVFHITVLLTFQLNGNAIVNVEERVKNTIILNTFVVCQIINEFSTRKLKKRNVLKGIYRNILFVGILGIAITLEILMVKFLKNFAETKRSYCVQWGICIAIAILSWLSQKEDAWSAENDFLTTMTNSMKKRKESESLKHVVKRLRTSGDERVQPREGLMLHVGIEKHYDAADASMGCVDTVESSQPDLEYNIRIM